jgi:hypothetical protein
MSEPADPALPATVRASKDVVWQEVEGQVVLLEMNAGRYYALDSVGSRMWEVLVEATSVAHARDRLLALFDVDAETLDHDLAELIGRLAGARLLVVAG